LNNDTLVTPGWLTALLDTFSEEPRAGIVGLKNLFFRMAVCRRQAALSGEMLLHGKYGKFDDSAKPQYNLSAGSRLLLGRAALMIPNALFHSVGRIRFALCTRLLEDTDLSFKVRLAGLQDIVSAT